MGDSERTYSTSQIANEVGMHPNSVRIYEAWGLLPPVPRAKNRYRIFSQRHLDHVRFVWSLLHWPYPGGKKRVLRIVEAATQGLWDSALDQIQQYLQRIEAEINKTNEACNLLVSWASGEISDPPLYHFSIGAAAKYLDVTSDTLRNWERNALIDIPRDPKTGYRYYTGKEINRLIVIRALRSAGYNLMSIHRMFRRFDAGETSDLLGTLNIPPEDEDIITVTDRWLSTLKNRYTKTMEAYHQLKVMKKKYQTLQ